MGAARAQPRDRPRRAQPRRAARARSPRALSPARSAFPTPACPGTPRPGERSRRPPRRHELVPLLMVQACSISLVIRGRPLRRCAGLHRTRRHAHSCWTAPPQVGRGVARAVRDGTNLYHLASVGNAWGWSEARPAGNGVIGAADRRSRCGRGRSAIESRAQPTRNRPAHPADPRSRRGCGRPAIATGAQLIGRRGRGGPAIGSRERRTGDRPAVPADGGMIRRCCSRERGALAPAGSTAPRFRISPCGVRADSRCALQETVDPGLLPHARRRPHTDHRPRVSVCGATSTAGPTTHGRVPTTPVRPTLTSALDIPSPPILDSYPGGVSGTPPARSPDRATGSRGGPGTGVETTAAEPVAPQRGSVDRPRTADAGGSR